MKPGVRKFLETKFKTSRTGGKGSMRRKIKTNRTRIINTRISKDEQEFKKIINNINNAIKAIDEKHLELWTIYFMDWVNDASKNFKKKDFNKSHRNLFVELQMDMDNFFYEFFLEIDDGRYCFINSYQFCKKCLTDNGWEYVKNSFVGLEKKINTQDYIFKGESETVDNVNKLLKLLDLSTHEHPTKESLKKAFLKKSIELHPDKHPGEIEKYDQLFGDVNKAYRQLLEYYFKDTNEHLYTDETN